MKTKGAICTHTHVELGRRSLTCLACGERVTETPFLLRTHRRIDLPGLGSIVRIGPQPPAASSDRDWWRAQDADTAWARQWEGDTDRTNPKEYK